MPHLRIKPFPAPVGVQYADDTWTVLRTAIEAILQKQPVETNFEDLYNHAYGMFLHKHGGMVQDNLRNVIAAHLESHVRNEVAQCVDATFLTTVKRTWDAFSSGMQILKDIFMYMDRKVDVQDTKTSAVYAMGLGLFRDTVLHFGRVKERLLSTLLELINKERKGDSVDRETIKGITVMLMDLGAGSRIVYEEDFERDFLADSAAYFRLESQKYFSDNSATDYIKNVEKLIQSEGERTMNCLDPSTKTGVDRLIDTELIEKHVETIINMPVGGVVSLIQNRNFTEMTAMYKILNRINEGIPKLLTPMSQYLRQQGTALMSDSTGTTKTPVQLIQALLDLKREYDLFLEKSFKKDPRLRKMIATDFEYFFNLNKKSPELLTLFIDEQLRNASKNVLTEQQLNTVLEQSMVLFRYLHDRDLFERYYKHFLARRLLNARGQAEEAEKTMLTKLRNEAGYSYTSKLEGMYRDILLSGTCNDKFQDHCFQNNIATSVELNVQVLTTGFWPMPPSPAPINLPWEAQKTFLEFRKLYLDMHNGRQLNLQNNLGTAEIAAEFYGPPAINDQPPAVTGATGQTVRKYMLQVTTYQMVVLMLFNKQPEWSYQDMATATNIPEKDLKRAIASLCTSRMRLLIKKAGIDLLLTTAFTLSYSV
ncbi:cullin-3-like isoform X2 [Paramacrobiotus metropolitanus]|uniref:cullin-3-like isoform X2 n=1 Tax=Paramacrobiotus metropolitanus TaxID=2943436 RepID=UPI00244623CB|nr:cullin-3-like isoform X2 [Paramacrobiotus metropolitanus]